jgi:hypothetical protein
MVRKIIKGLVTLAGFFIGFLSFVFLITLPGMLRLPRPGWTTLEGVTTIEDAADACQKSGLKGWELAAYAQRLAARKFSYSRRNAWDTPARAFKRGMGYCQQQALALKMIYDRLGIESRPVYTTRAMFPPIVGHGVYEPEIISGHTWLRVRIDGEERDVCPGRVGNYPGKIHFVVFGKVQLLTPGLAVVSHFGSTIVNVLRDARSGALWRA